MKTVLAFSGGLDSTVLLHDLVASGDEVLALTVDYGQRHRVEIGYAEQTAKRLGLEWRIADLSSITGLIAGSSQTSVGSSRVDLQACKLEYSIVSPK